MATAELSKHIGHTPKEARQVRATIRDILGGKEVPLVRGDQAIDAISGCPSCQRRIGDAIRDGSGESVYGKDLTGVISQASNRLHGLGLNNSAPIEDWVRS